MHWVINLMVMSSYYVLYFVLYTLDNFFNGVYTPGELGWKFKIAVIWVKHKQNIPPLFYIYSRRNDVLLGE